MDDVETAYYLRLTAADKPGVLADITRILADRGISIEALIQKKPLSDKPDLPVIMLTHRVQERKMSQAIEAIEALDTVSGSVHRIRMETLG